MKKLFYLFCFSFVLQTAQAQREPNYAINTELLQKSKSQRATGLVLLGVGAATTLVGFSVGLGHALENLFQEKYQAKGTGAMVAGLTLMAVSIPLFVASGKNKRASLSVSNFPKSQMNSGDLLTLHSTPQLNITLTSRLFTR